MINGICHCGTVQWQFDGSPTSATACNCTICRRYGVLWAYAHEGHGIDVSGPTQAYVWGDKSIGFHFCATCGCIAYWRAVQPGKNGLRRIAVNLRLATPEAVGSIVVDHFGGLNTWQDLPRDGKCVADMWF
jgi:hypothetical protein